MKWNAYIFTNACYQCKWEKEAYYQSRLLRSTHLCTLTGNKHLFVSRTQDILSSAYNKKWRSCPTFIVMDDTSHTYLDVVQRDRFEASIFSQSWKWSLFLRSFVVLKVSKPFWSRISDFFFLPLDECTRSVASIIRTVDGLCKSSCEEGLVWNLWNPCQRGRWMEQWVCWTLSRTVRMSDSLFQVCVHLHGCVHACVPARVCVQWIKCILPPVCSVYTHTA